MHSPLVRRDMSVEPAVDFQTGSSIVEASFQVTKHKRSRSHGRQGIQGRVFLFALVLALTGLGLYRVTTQMGFLALSLVGLLLFAIAAWINARPERGGDVGHPDINPWTIG
jgi:hypothetical protein